LIDGQYPDYKQIIPTNFQTTLVTDRAALISALRTTAVFSQNNNSTRLDFIPEKEMLVLAAESSDLGKSSIELPSKIDGKGGSLLLNYHYLLDCLNVIDSKNVIVKIIDDASPSLLLPEGNDNYVYLVMPIKS
ncbi:MAG TPA: DNA polymerase III subunit beta, partial [Candidatus Limnocylindria bacterium]|nr:DNA polymerase III subunit beta [Candidatus Limnocylindria bacterium]